MERLTEKDLNGKCYGYDIGVSMNDTLIAGAKIKNCIHKLGQYEDIDEELGIDWVILFKALKYGIYGTMYGETIDRLISDVVYIEPRSFKLVLHAKEPCIYYEWGWPGPDANRYKLVDYGKTWALTKDALLENE